MFNQEKINSKRRKATEKKIKGHRKKEIGQSVSTGKGGSTSVQYKNKKGQSTVKRLKEGP